MKIAIVEDEQQEQEKLKRALDHFAEEQHADIDCSVFSDPSYFIHTFKGEYDIILLDIQMPGFDGVELARRIRRLDSQVVMIFITSMIQRALDGYKVQALDFIVKPWTYFQLRQTMQTAMRLCRKEKPARVQLKTGERVLYVEMDDILYIEVMRHRLYYHLADGRNLEVWGNLSDVEQTLPEAVFARCNQCYLVNLHHVKGLEQDMVQVGNDTLKMSRGRKNEFTEKLMNTL